MTNQENKRKSIWKRDLTGNTTLILVIAILFCFGVGGLLGAISTLLGLGGGIDIFRQRNNPSIPRGTKILRIILFIIWLFLFGIISNIKSGIWSY